MDRLAAEHPEMRFRFTSPHPKDFPDDLLEVIRDRPNACASLHIPAQSGSTRVLQSMRRGYSRDTYLALIDRVRELLPHASLSSDFISGFCGETEADHMETLSLLEAVRFDKAFMFAYSMREKTHAHRRLEDDVPEPTKLRRLREVRSTPFMCPFLVSLPPSRAFPDLPTDPLAQVIDTFSAGARAANQAEVHTHHLVLLEGPSKKPRADGTIEWAGRTESNKRVVLERRALRDATAADGSAAADARDGVRGGRATDGASDGGASPRHLQLPQAGEYVAVRVTEALSANTLRAEPLAISSVAHFARARW